MTVPSPAKIMSEQTIRNVNPSFDAIIIGGGLAGLVCAISLSRAGHRVMVIEKKAYPFHKVCGEYVSNEVSRYLQSLGFDPHAYGASRIVRSEERRVGKECRS